MQSEGYAVLRPLNQKSQLPYRTPRFIRLILGDRHASRRLPTNVAMLHCPNAHATIRGNSSCQNASPCDPGRSFMTTSAPASRSASAQRAAFLRKNGSRVPATKYVRGIERGIITLGGR